MSTRRVFLKTIFGLGALALPWTLWPSRFGKGLEFLVGQTPVRLSLPEAAIVDTKDGKDPSSEIMENIFRLASPDLQGRRAGTAGETKAADYLIQELSLLELKPLGSTDLSFVQAFTIPPVIESVVNGRLTFRPGEQADLRTPSANILGGFVGEQPEEVVLLSAHYDHLGVFEGQLYPGANDNASGVACILAVMRRLIQEKVKLKRTVVIAFWSAEEMGFVGSNAFVKNPPIPLKRIKAVFNVDTVGNGRIGDFALWAEGPNDAVKALQTAAAAVKARVPLVPFGGHNSDQVSFAGVGIPAVTLMSADWLEDNHTVKDTPEFVQPEQIKLASEIIYRAVNLLAEKI
ncbi:MAG: M28 family metallopeptidase [Desulfitobacteriaceae bacterium]